jgi:DMSO/TMAO reductase YedYZ molybdopterin-dependent catalytic subunit
MKDLRANFRHRKVTATLQCAGNRRRDMLQVRSVSGDPWAPGAIGNAEWGGASLRDVLKAAGDLELVVRAWDSAGQTQPALPDETWNFKGYLSTAWHRVKVIVS